MVIVQVVFSSDIFELQKFGGISRYFVELAKGLSANRKCEVSIATRIHINSYLYNSSVNAGFYLPTSPTRLKLDPIVTQINTSHSSKISSRNNFDIKHETFYRQNIEYLKAKKYVTTVYDLIREKSSDTWDGFSRKRKSLLNADHIIAISTNTAHDLIEFYDVNPNKVSVIHLGVSSVFLHSELTSSNAIKKKQILYVGERGGYKDFSTLVEAYGTSKFLRENFHVLVFGPKFTRDELNHLETYKLASNFKHRSGDDQRLLEAYRESAALVVTSKYEGFGLPVLEAMANLCLVFTTRLGSLSEIAGNLDVPFEVSNPESLKNSLETYLVQLPHLTPHLLIAKNHAKQFTWESVVNKTYNLYTSIASKE